MAKVRFFREFLKNIERFLEKKCSKIHISQEIRKNRTKPQKKKDKIGQEKQLLLYEHKYKHELVNKNLELSPEGHEKLNKMSPTDHGQPLQSSTPKKGHKRQNNLILPNNNKSF